MRLTGTRHINSVIAYTVLGALTAVIQALTTPSFGTVLVNMREFNLIPS